jgi:hypothetical protein
MIQFIIFVVYYTTKNTELKTYNTLIVPVALHFLNMREECKLLVLEEN